MTGWAQALSSAQGVVAWPYDAALADVEAAVTEQGARFVLLDGSEVGGRVAFLELCEQAFDLPEWFGRNWDALEECLTDLADRAVVVAWAGWEVLEDADPEAYATAVDVFDGVARRYAADGARFAVLRLEGDRS